MAGMYAGMHSHAPGHQEPGHQVPALTRRHIPQKGVHDIEYEASCEQN